MVFGLSKYLKKQLPAMFSKKAVLKKFAISQENSCDLFLFK